MQPMWSAGPQHSQHGWFGDQDPTRRIQMIEIPRPSKYLYNCYIIWTSQFYFVRMFTNIYDLEGLGMYMFQCYFSEKEVINVYLNMTKLVGLPTCSGAVWGLQWSFRDPAVTFWGGWLSTAFWSTKMETLKIHSKILKLPWILGNFYRPHYDLTFFIMLSKGEVSQYLLISG